MSKIGFQIQDNWEQFNYNVRYFDALASLFHIQDYCTTIKEYEGKIYLSYNMNASNSSKKCISFIDSVLKKITDYSPDNLLGIYLIFNDDIKELVSKSRKHVGEAKSLLEEFLLVRANIYPNINKGINSVKNLNSDELAEKYTAQIVEKYKVILEHFTVDETLKIHLQTFLRPLQDCYKLYHYFTKEQVYTTAPIEVLSNSNKIHADCNIANYFPVPSILDKNYIGVSKLCCGYCHKYLEEGKHGHRGTHGVCDDKWHLASPQEIAFKNSVVSIASITDMPSQYRRLSTDNFEKDISFNETESLIQWKTKLGLSNIKQLSAENITITSETVDIISNLIVPSLGRDHTEDSI